MKYLKSTLFSTALLAVPFITLAQVDLAGNEIEVSLRNILEFINTTAIPFIIGIAFLFFVWGIFQFFIAGGANDESKEKGKSLMIYATLGFVIIIVFWGLINLIAGGTGLDKGEFKYDIKGPTIN